MSKQLCSRLTWQAMALISLALVGCEREPGTTSGRGTKSAPASLALGPESSAIKPTLDGGWYGGHGVPESVCARCNKGLVATFKRAGDWCQEHGLPESQCVLCHPEVEAKWAALKPDGDAGAQKHGTPSSDGQPVDETRSASDERELGPATSPIKPTLDKGWCGGHGVPESVCTRCNDSLIPPFKEAGDWCQEHGLPETQCTECHPEVAARWAALEPNGDGGESKHKKDEPGSGPHSTAPTTPLRNGTARRAALPPSSTCTNSETPVRLQSADVVRTAGLQFAQVREEPLSATITRNAEITYNANQYARLSSRASGVVAKVLRDFGDAVTAGEALAIVDSAELGSTKAEYLQSLASVDLWQQTAKRERLLADQGIGAKREALEAESRLAEERISLAKSRQRLRNLGLTDDDISSIERTQDTSSLLQLAAPFDSIVVDRSAVRGEVVDTAKTMFVLANIDTMWAMIDLYETDLPNVAMGQNTVFTRESVPGQTFRGQITWISAELDPATRTLKARAEIANDNGLLRANTFGSVQIVVRRGERAIVIPKEAVQWDGCCNLVFVKANEDGTVFHPQQVRLGIDTGRGYETLSGVEAGAVLVTAGSYLLKTEVLKGSIGAGCCDHVEKLDR